MEAIFSPETSGSLRTTRHYNQQDRILNSYLRENVNILILCKADMWGFDMFETGGGNSSELDAMYRWFHL
jgi:hypothetical protein